MTRPTSQSADTDPESARSLTRITSSSTTERIGGGIETAPLVFIGVGGSLAVVGSVPLVVTMSLGVNSSATIIGVGFVGFGFLIFVPGLCWCIVSNMLIQYHRRGFRLACCGGSVSSGATGGNRRRRLRHARRTMSTEQEVELLVFSDTAATGHFTDATPILLPPAQSCDDHDVATERNINDSDGLKLVNCTGDTTYHSVSSVAIGLVGNDNR